MLFRLFLDDVAGMYDVVYVKQAKNTFYGDEWGGQWNERPL